MLITGTEEDWDLDEVLDGLPCNIRTTNEIPYDERDITTVTGTMRINGLYAIFYCLNVMIILGKMYIHTKVYCITI